VAGKEEAEKRALQVGAAVAIQPHLVTFECKREDLPSMVPEPSPQQWTEYYNLWGTLDALARQEAMAGIQVPVNFLQLQAGIEVPRHLLGEAIWRQAFPVDPGPDTVLTFQVRQLLSLSLQTHQAKLLNDKSKQEAATKQVEGKIGEAVMEYRAKRSRTSA